MTELIGTRLNQYELRDIIRRGGMSTVYRAYQESLDRFVAVKVLFIGRDQQFAARFKREARAIAALQHHNILPVYDYGEQEGLLFLVLQYIENGATLGDMLGHPMAPSTALRLTSHVLDALDYAHQRGVIHRDIKPGNVLMPSPNWPMLADFGIAKLMNDNQARLTLANQIIGTAAYMAPEQATGRPIDARTDLYAAGVVLYELITGRVPFDADTPMAVLTKHVYEPPPPARSLNPDVPASIELLLQKALAKDPNQRYQSAADMAEELRGVAAQIDRDPKRSQVTGLYQVGLMAFEQGHWDEAVDRLGQLVSIDPDYEDAGELLEAAREAQDRAKTEARQRIEMVRQQRASGVHQQMRPATEASPPLPANPSTPQPAPAGDQRTSILKTSKLPELDAPTPAVPTRPLTPGTQPLSELAAPAASAGATPASGAAAAASQRKLPIAWIAAGAVVVALLLGLVFILRGGRPAAVVPEATAAAAPTSAGGAASAPTAGESPTAAAETQSGGTSGGRPAPPPAGKIVFQDDFNSKDGLVQSGLEDNVRATDFQRGIHPPGIYHMLLLGNNDTRVELLPRALYQDFSVQVDLTDNSDDTTGSVAQGLVFRAQDQQRYYMFLVDARAGKYTLRRQNGPDQRSELIPFTASPLIKSGKDTNQLRIDAKGDQFTFYMNGVELASFSDKTYAQGMLGMTVANVDANKPHMHFDNLKIWSDDAPAAAPKLPRDRTNPAGNMVLIAAGPFILGGYDHADSQPNVVQLDNFYIDKTEVTNGAYRKCVNEGKCSPPKQTDSQSHPNYAGDPKYDTFPVMFVTYDQARDFCGWAGKRLPTEAEWEKAASWNTQVLTKTLYPWGNVFDPKALNSAEANNQDAVAVGSFAPEINGTFDMGGNLSEWTSSLAKPYPYVDSDGREEYPAPGERVFRGGSWAQTQGKAKVFGRFSAPPNYFDREIGFRCAVSP